MKFLQKNSGMTYNAHFLSRSESPKMPNFAVRSYLTGLNRGVHPSGSMHFSRGEALANCNFYSKPLTD